jgi:ABC-2 type transport system ATP-binding protein
MSGDSDPGVQIALEGVRREYGSVVAVDGVDLRIGGGQFHCLLGPNGSGKSTLFRLILGLTQPTDGSIEVADVTVGCGFQQPNFYPELTARENITVFANLVGATDWGWNQSVVEELRLQRALDREAAALSGGFARKLDLALALIKKPDVLLLDEPLGALDDVSMGRLLEFLGEYAAAGNTVVVSTHHASSFEPYLDRVTVMHRGSVAFDATLADLDLGERSLQEYYVSEILDREGIDAEDVPDTGASR